MALRWGANRTPEVESPGIFGDRQPVIGWYGLFLQLGGIATVIIGIEQTRKAFGHEPVIQSWYRRVRGLFLKSEAKAAVLTMSAQETGG